METLCGASRYSMKVPFILKTEFHFANDLLTLIAFTASIQKPWSATVQLLMCLSIHSTKTQLLNSYIKSVIYIHKLDSRKEAFKSSLVQTLILSPTHTHTNTHYSKTDGSCQENKTRVIKLAVFCMGHNKVLFCQP